MKINTPIGIVLSWLSTIMLLFRTKQKSLKYVGYDTNNILVHNLLDNYLIQKIDLQHPLHQEP
jgi:hypothetical protein